MLNAILNGGLGESRSGSNTTTTKYVTLPNEAKRVTVEEWNTIYKPVESLYVEAYGYAYSNNIKQPKWDDVVLYREAVVDSYKNGKVFNADEYIAQIQQQQQQQQPAATQQQQQQAEPQTDKWQELENTISQTNFDELISDEDDYRIDGHTSPALQEMIENAREARNNQSRSGNSTPLVTVAPSEEKGSSLLVPGIILALGVIGAIALTSKSKKRR